MIFLSLFSIYRSDRCHVTVRRCKWLQDCVQDRMNNDHSLNCFDPSRVEIIARGHMGKVNGCVQNRVGPAIYIQQQVAPSWQVSIGHKDDFGHVQGSFSSQLQFFPKTISVRSCLKQLQILRNKIKSQKLEKLGFRVFSDSHKLTTKQLLLRI